MIVFSVVGVKGSKPGWQLCLCTDESPDAPEGESMTIGMAEPTPDKQAAVANALRAVKVPGETGVHIEDIDLVERTMVIDAGVTYFEVAPAGARTFVALVNDA